MRPIDRPFDTFVRDCWSVDAVPMSRLEYNEYRGWELPEDEDGDDAGFMVIDRDGDSNSPDVTGYVSWMPEDEFKRIYHDISEGVSFGAALEAAKSGLKIYREGWNGKQQFVFKLDVSSAEFSEEFGEPFPEVLCIRTTSGKVQIGWLASQSDMLSYDWHVMV